MFQTFTLFDAAQAGDLLGRVRALDFADGKLTASGVAAARKNNRQAQRSPARDEIALQVVNALQQHRHLSSWTLPRYYSVPIFNRAGEGEFYGEHVDMARMVGLHGWPMRTDVSYTLFLAPPESYDGGALRIQLPYREVNVKLPAGSIVLYPSTLAHEVLPVTRGERFCVAGWIESMVHSTAHRDLLYRLSVHFATVDKLHPDDAVLQHDMSALMQGFIKELAQ